MQVSTMRRADRWLGLPVCFLLTAIRKVFQKEDGSVAARPTGIVFVKLAEQGSTVLASQAIRRAIAMVGAERVFFLVFEENRHVLDAMDLVPAGNVITIPTPSMAGTVLGAYRAIRRLRRARVDTAIDLEFFARSSAALAFLSGARWRTGFHGFSGEASYRGDLLTHRVSFNPYLHTSQTFELLVAALERVPATLPTFDMVPQHVEDVLPTFTPEADEPAQVRQIVSDAAGCDTSGRLILLNANASDLVPLRRWPLERYVELAKRLLTAYPDAVIGFTGAPAEAPRVMELLREVGSPRAICLAGRTTMRQLLVLYGLAEVMVTNDSGPAHFAALTSIDVVTLFGPETPMLFGALTPRNHVLWAGLACSPCINAFNDRQSACTNNVCMQRITVDHVFAEVCRAYNARVERRGAAASSRG
jgi:ADP-heptose:LPS heptosyltransferase